MVGRSRLMVIGVVGALALAGCGGSSSGNGGAAKPGTTTAGQSNKISAARYSKLESAASDLVRAARKGDLAGTREAENRFSIALSGLQNSIANINPSAAQAIIGDAAGVTRAIGSHKLHAASVEADKMVAAIKAAAHQVLGAAAG